MTCARHGKDPAGVSLRLDSRRVGCSGAAGFGSTPVSHMYMQCCTVVVVAVDASSASVVYKAPVLVHLLCYSPPARPGRASAA